MIKLLESILHQVNIQLHLDINARKSFRVYVHNKGQMLFPRRDNIFGSHSYALDWDPEEVTIKNQKFISFRQHFELERTRSKTIDTPKRRCDAENKAKTTECIAKFLEDSIGCSMGLAGSRSEAERYVK